MDTISKKERLISQVPEGRKIGTVSSGDLRSGSGVTLPVEKPRAEQMGTGQAQPTAYAAPQSAPSVQSAPASVPSGSGYSGDYVPSQSVQQALAALQEQMGNKPGDYTSAWQKNLDDILGKILNREKFSYDLNGDALYQQYKDRYIQQGQQAMQDTMGQAAAMTGGYGNSYAQTVGQQTYQGYLQGLNDKVPELYQLALDAYNQEGSNLLNQYGLLSDRENADYERYRDSMSDYYANLDRLQNQYNTERNFDYGQFSDQRNYDYQKGRDAVSDDQWNKSFQYQQDRDKISDEQWQKQFDESKRQYDQEWNYKVSHSGGSGGSGSSSGGAVNAARNTLLLKNFNNSNSGIYNAAVDRLKAQGIDSVPMTREQWERQHQYYPDSAIGSYKSYTSYLRDYVEYLESQN